MAKNLPGGVPAVRLSSHLQLAAFFPPSGRGGRGGRRRSAPTPALMVDLRVVIRRNFPVGPGSRRIVHEVAEDIVLRRQHARKLRLPERMERALAADVLPLVEHPFDRGAVVASTEKICQYVATVCADPRLAKGGAQVLVLLDTFACPALLRPLPRKPMRIPAEHGVVAMRIPASACTKMESGIATEAVEKARPIGVIGDGHLKQADDGVKQVEEERWKGWLPW
ncbi:unnamed protein product [Alopecurus aequalis]